MSCPRLIVITGATGSGKTGVAIELAQHYGCPIINADSRQIYKDIPIGTAAPTEREQALVQHYFVGTKDLHEYYSAAQYEADVLVLLPQLFTTTSTVVMCGGSMMYVDAVCRGIDEIPTISEGVRRHVKQLYEQHGMELILSMLQDLDQEHYATVDRKNPKRVIHAVEVCLQSGTTYSSLRTGQAKQRPFDIIKIGLQLEREVLFNRINTRVEDMFRAGLLAEAERVYPLRELNALNTVGYKELFAYFDGIMDLNTARERIKKNTRVYAKKQLTWYRRDALMHWLAPEEVTPERIAKIARGGM